MEGSAQQGFNVDTGKPESALGSTTGPDPPNRSQWVLMGLLLLLSVVVFGFCNKTQAISKERQVLASVLVAAVSEPMVRSPPIDVFTSNLTKKLAAKSPWALAFSPTIPGSNLDSRLRGRTDTVFPREGSHNWNQQFPRTTMSLASEPGRWGPEASQVKPKYDGRWENGVSSMAGDPLEKFYEYQDSARVRYTLPMAERVAYFVGQAATLSTLTSTADDASETLSADADQLDPVAVMLELQDALFADEESADWEGSHSVRKASAPEAVSTEWIFNNERVEAETASVRETQGKKLAGLANILEPIIALLKKDLANIETGKYKMPCDLDSKRPQKVTGGLPWSLVGQFYVKHLQWSLPRSKALRNNHPTEAVRKELQTKLYPAYYLDNINNGSDAWLHPCLYDHRVELRFLGTADAMRRQVLPQLVNYIHEIRNPVLFSGGALDNRHEKNIKLLDAATGTGRFASFVLNNSPELDVTVLDLSSFALQEAQNVLRPFPQVTYMQAAAEDIDAEDETYDAISCVYLFHELPLTVRRDALREFFRVLKPGGKLFFVDSAQEGEMYDLVFKESTLRVHEPYYADSSKMHLKELMEGVGFLVESEEMHWVSKAFVAVKPADSDNRGASDGTLDHDQPFLL